MSISNSQVDPNNRTPGVFSEFDASKAVNALQVLTRMLVIGQRTSAGTVAASVPFEVQSLDAAKDAAGVGSHFADTMELVIANNPNIRITGILVDDGAAVAATKTITVTGTATAAATLNVYIAGRKVVVAVANGDDANTIAANIEAAVDANTDIILDASSATNVVTLTAKNGGEWTDKLVVSVNPFTSARGGNELDPAGVTFAVADGVTGSGNPSIAAAIAAIPDDRFDYILQPYVDDANCDLMDAELVSRQDAMVQLEGHSFNAIAGTLSDATTFGASRNSQHSTTMYAGNGSISPEHHWAGAYIGQASRTASNDPAVPWQLQVLSGITPEFKENQLIRSERNTLLQSGVATHLVTDAGAAQIERGITNYQTNGLGQPDTSFLDSQTPLTLSFLRQSFLNHFSPFLQGKKLAKDGTNLSGGSNTVTPSIIRGECISLAQQWIDLELVEQIEQFKTDLIVEIDAGDPNRVNVQMSPDLVNQLRIIANKILFIL